jgi:poly(3-hydroxyalkanoate) synthetase
MAEDEAGRRGGAPVPPFWPMGPAGTASPANWNDCLADPGRLADSIAANPMLRDAYLLASAWLLRQAEQAEMDPRQRQRLVFHLRQFTDATSPALLFASNPAAIQRALETGGASLVDGTRNLLEDLAAGRLSMVDDEAFAPGRNLALSPGKVVLRNALCELIQYALTTEQAHARPAAFDLLYWNADGTRITRAAHSWYLRNTYVENRLVQPGGVELAGEKLDLKDIRLPIYAVGAERDHIVPWDAAWQVTRLVGGEVRFVLANSGHIAGIINPPGGKGYYFTAPADLPAADAESWRQGAGRNEGSWWADWTAWLAARSGAKAKPPAMGSRRHPPIADAPGTYVLEK